MNPHIIAGTDALRRRDRQTAIEEFLKALEDEDPLVQRIAKNRLVELSPEQVYASPQSYQRLFHRPTCPAQNRMYKRNIRLLKDWQEAVSAGYQPCPMCKPSRVVPFVFRVKAS